MRRLLLLPTVVIVEIVVMTAEAVIRLIGAWDKYNKEDS